MAEKLNVPDGVQYTAFVFRDHGIANGGHLPDFEMGAHACWYYIICAHKNLKSVDEGATYEGENDHILALNNVAVSVATQYGLEDPGVFMRYMPVCVAEAHRCNLEIDARVMQAGNHVFNRTMS